MNVLSNEPSESHDTSFAFKQILNVESQELVFDVSVHHKVAAFGDDTTIIRGSPCTFVHGISLE
jgi:hypothetical protein